MNAFVQGVLPDLDGVKDTARLQATVMDLLRKALGSDSLTRDGSEMSATHRFLFLQGIFYCILGGMFAFMPSTSAMLVLAFLDDAEAAMLRLTGVAVFVIGYFYIQGARSNSPTFVAETCFDRLVLVPPLLLLMILYSRFMLCLAFLLLDPLLALLTALRFDQEKLAKGAHMQQPKAD